VPCTAGHPTDVIFLTCDASVCCARQRALAGAGHDHFISGYTAKVAGTEMGVKEPQATFSPASATVPRLASEQARRTARGEMPQANARVWLVNTGGSAVHTASENASV